MRRGHAGIGGWRNENPRHFRPRGGGPPPFRPNRSFPLQEPIRFPPPGSRPPRGSYSNRTGILRTPPPESHDRNKYRYDARQGNQYRPQDRNQHQGERSFFPLVERMRHEPKDQGKYKEKHYYDSSKHDKWHQNSMGDIDERQTNSDRYGAHPISPWNSTDKRPYYDERITHHLYGHDVAESGKVPVLEYSAHRPPSSDHYGGNPSSTLDNSNSFSRSVDDTVDIIRKRLQNRSEQQETLEDQNLGNNDIDDRVKNLISANYQNALQSQPVKKRVQRQKQNIDSNCDKMKSKIVHELFKMDKDKIHKLMDNPSSSSKFEYALNSFITESQNSLNRHLRSVAEKSLCSSEEFVHNYNNTIYEDTFMKQMQGVLDPQDSILLEDIKPLVLAELSKVLQLNEYDQSFQVIEEQGTYDIPIETQNYDEHYKGYGGCSQNQYYDQPQSPQQNMLYQDFESPNNEKNIYTNYEYLEPEPAKPKPLFERRSTKKSMEDSSGPTHSSASRRQSRTSNDANAPQNNNLFSDKRRNSRRSIDNKISEEKEKTLPLFDTNADQLSDDEDPFAEFDKQYHVAVDHNFIEADISSPQQSTSNAFYEGNSSYNQQVNDKTISTNESNKSFTELIDGQLQSYLKSQTLSKTQDKVTDTDKKSSGTSSNAAVQVKREMFPTPTKPSDDNDIALNVNMGNTAVQVKREIFATPTKTRDDNDIALDANVKQEDNIDSNEHSTAENAENINIPTKLLPSHSRKRLIDQKPSHRKEKRKKSDSSLSDSGKQILNKNIIINVNDCASSDAEKCNDATKSVFNLYFSKSDTAKEVPKETKKSESTDKPYSEKYVKRKEMQKKNETDNTKKKRDRSISSSHSISPKENLNNNSQSNKSESKTKLQSIDMFSEKPKRIAQMYAAFSKNVNAPVKTEVIKPKPTVISFNKKVTKRHVSTQVFQKTHSKDTQTFQTKSVTTRFCQTERNRMLNKLVQTIPVRIEKQQSKATDAFERMKEIDLEIQILLQEKFKLYSSIEASVPCPSTIQSLGMTVVNVSPDEETKENDANETEVLSGDDIVEDFTNIPVEELEQLAFESIQNEDNSKKRSRQQRILSDSRASSSSPTTRRKIKKGKEEKEAVVGNTPNISLLEQIITDDRPIEDIISLDDLETTPIKSKKQKKVHNVPKKKGSKKTKRVKPSIKLIDYDLKPCSVVLIRADLTKYFKENTYDVEVQNEVIPVSVEHIVEQEIPIEESNIIVEETVTNDLQFDMLDVSEDIVIGDNCEVKLSVDDKDMGKVVVVPNEEIILDNSQSSETVQTESSVADNICKTYDFSTDENLRRDSVVVTGHADAVLAIECIENNFIAACLDGNVYHFGADGQLITTLRGSNLAVTCLTIVKEKYGTTVYTGSLDSRIRYYDLETGLEKGPECNVLSPIQTMDRAWDTIFVGTRTGFVLQFECKNNMLIPVSTVKFSEQSILALRAMKEGPRKVLLVAARSEDVTIKDAQTGLLLRSLQGPKMTVYTLLYEDGKIYCGTSSHQIHVFDYASGAHVGAHTGGKGAVCLRAAGGLVFAGCYDGCVYVYREGEPQPLAHLRGPTLMLLSLAVLDTRIIAGYKDRSLYIWKIPESVQQEMIL